MGIFTPISFASFYVLLIWTFLNGNVLAGAVTFGLFGLARAALPTLAAPFVRTHESACTLSSALMSYHSTVVRATGFVLVGMAPLALVQAVS